jgi:hypothetical protein
MTDAEYLKGIIDKAIYQINLMRGSGLIDLNMLTNILKESD